MSGNKSTCLVGLNLVSQEIARPEMASDMAEDVVGMVVADMAAEDAVDKVVADMAAEDAVDMAVADMVAEDVVDMAVKGAMDTVMGLKMDMGYQKAW
ncbi:hypothetical protein [Lysinibacillus xylanilyticus]|uniref:Uncharacterized protein n=1 Tax=Lysinibacillus xylanilyticus TaxID=582475 RepID=A0ABT4ETI3_9BACI|nr:hypothetical protein [Lysinibacillus xylanilyticus]MCY9548979.1 hypothetical protein [Lysinibacillus xylanilyticus]